jgi:hypothetical protein
VIRFLAIGNSDRGGSPTWLEKSNLFVIANHLIAARAWLAGAKSLLKQQHLSDHIRANIYPTNESYVNFTLWEKESGTFVRSTLGDFGKRFLTPFPSLWLSIG